MHIFLTSALVGGEWSVSRPCRFTPGKEPPGTHWTGGWEGLRAGLDDEETILDPTGTELRHLGRAARSQSLYRLSYPGHLLSIRHIILTVAINLGCTVHERRNVGHQCNVDFTLEEGWVGGGALQRGGRCVEQGAVRSMRLLSNATLTGPQRVTFESSAHLIAVCLTMSVSQSKQSYSLLAT
jgi:hypothetical protein